MKCVTNYGKHNKNRKSRESNNVDAYQHLHQFRRISSNSRLDDLGEENNFDTLIAINRSYLASLIAIYQDLIVKKQYHSFENVVQFHREQG